MESHQKTLDARVQNMRSQTMSFSKDGLEFALNVPNSYDVQDIFTSMVTSIVHQQDQIHTLKQCITQIVDDNIKSQEGIVAWATEAITALTKSNSTLAAKLDEQSQQIKNIGHNIQGFVDEDTSESNNSTIKFDIENIQISSQTLQISLPPNITASRNLSTAMLSTIEDHGEMSMLSEKLKRMDSMSESGGVSTNVSPSKRDRDRTSAVYNSAAKNSLPVAPHLRWRWAIRKVLLMVRVRKVGMMKTRLAKGHSLLERLEALESGVHSIPALMVKELRAETVHLTQSLKQEIDNLNKLLALQQEQGNAVQATIETCNNKISTFIENADEKFSVMRSYVDDSVNKMGDNLLHHHEKLLNTLMNEKDQYLEALNTRVCDLQEVTEGCRSTVTEIARSVPRVRVRDSTVDVDMAVADKLALTTEELLKQDTELRFARSRMDAAMLMVSNCKTMGLTVQREISLFRERADDSHSDSLMNLLISCAAIDQSLAIADKGLLQLQVLWSRHDQILALKWGEFMKSRHGDHPHLEVWDRPSGGTGSNDQPQISLAGIEAQLEPLIRDLIEMNLGEGGNKSMGLDKGEIICLAAEFEVLSLMGTEHPIDDEESKHSNAVEVGCHVRILHGTFADREGVVVGEVAPSEHNYDDDIDDGSVVMQQVVNKTPRSARQVEAINVSAATQKYRIVLEPSSGKGRVQVVADASALQELRCEVGSLATKLEELFISKLDAAQAQHLLAVKADTADLDFKADMNMLATVEKSVREVLTELGGLKDLQEKELSEVKQALKDSLTAALNRSFTSPDMGASVLTTKTLCLGCGREAVPRHANSQHRPASPPALHPTLNSHSLPGPDVLRAGFKMAVRMPGAAKSPEGASSADPNQDVSLILTEDQKLLLLGGDNAAGSTQKRVSSAARAIRHAQGREESEWLRPIYRKGFPGKKSDRAATAYAPERYLLQDTSLSRLDAMNTMSTASSLLATGHGVVHAPVSRSSERPRSHR